MTQALSTNILTDLLAVKGNAPYVSIGLVNGFLQGGTEGSDAEDTAAVCDVLAVYDLGSGRKSA